MFLEPSMFAYRRPKIFRDMIINTEILNNKILQN